MEEEQQNEVAQLRFRASLNDFEEAEQFLGTGKELSSQNTLGTPKINASKDISSLKQISVVETSESVDGIPANSCEIHPSKNAKYVETNGNPSFWKYFCSGCAIELAQKGKKLFKISKSKRISLMFGPNDSFISSYFFV